jgi:hypothetical protein
MGNDFIIKNIQQNGCTKKVKVTYNLDGENSHYFLSSCFIWFESEDMLVFHRFSTFQTKVFQTFKYVHAHDVVNDASSCSIYINVKSF